MYKNCKRSWLQIRGKDIKPIIFIIFLEILSIFINQFSVIMIKDENREIGYFFVVQLIFFIFFNFFLYIFYKKFLDLNKKINIFQDYLNKDERYKISYLKNEVWSIRLLEIIEEWKLKNLSSLNEERKRFNQLLMALDSSVSLFDREFNLIVKNDSLNFLFKNGEGDYIKIFKYRDIIEVIDSFRLQNKDIIKEIYVDEIGRYLEIKIKNIKDGNIVIVKDITHNKAVIDVQKRFVSNVGHELKTPLTNIKGYLIAFEEASDEEIKSQFMSTIKNNIEKLENIISDFLNITKIESLNIVRAENIKFERLKNELEEILKERIERTDATITYNLNLLNREEELYIDYDKILMVLKNLVENGLIYKRDIPPQIEISIIETKNRYKFGVKDNGLGIPKNKFEKIFERFYRVDKARTSNKAGTGLGLAIVKEIIERYNGKVEVISEEGKGSLFIFTILK